MGDCEELDGEVGMGGVEEEAPEDAEMENEVAARL